VQPRALYVPLHFGGGAVAALFVDGQAAAPVEVTAAAR